MDARQWRSKSELMKFHKRADSLPPSARSEAFDQSYGSANYNVQQNIRMLSSVACELAPLKIVFLCVFLF